MTEINGSSEKMSRAMRVIDEIAFQTNLLALNAGIESTRAGNAGIAFARVAGEVRNLAHGSAQAARDTAALIEETVSGSQGEGGGLGPLAANVAESAEANQELAVQAQHLYAVVERVRRSAGAVEAQAPVLLRSSSHGTFPPGDRK